MRECDSFVGVGDRRAIGVVEVAARVLSRPSLARMAYRFCAGWPAESHCCVSKNAYARSRGLVAAGKRLVSQAFGTGRVVVCGVGSAAAAVVLWRTDVRADAL